MEAAAPCSLSPTMLSAPLGAELQLRGGGGDAEACARGARRYYHSQQSCIIWALAPWLPHSSHHAAPCCSWPNFQPWLGLRPALAPLKCQHSGPGPCFQLIPPPSALPHQQLMPS